MPSLAEMIQSAEERESRRAMEHNVSQSHNPTLSQVIGRRASFAIRNPLEHAKMSLRDFVSRYLPSEEDRAKQRLAMQGSVMGDWQPSIEKVMDLFGAAPMAAPITWHGSPHKFKPTKKNPLGEFDAAHIGKGEGAQAYGHGLYLADVRGTGMTYKKDLSPEGFRVLYKGTPLNETGIGRNFVARDHINSLSVADDFLAEKAAQVSILNKQLKKALSENDPEAGIINEALEFIKSLSPEDIKTVELGHLYKVDLPDEMVPRMLDWDAPLSEQPDILKRLMGETEITTDLVSRTGSPSLEEIEDVAPILKKLGLNEQSTGEDLYKAIAFEAPSKRPAGYGEKEASAYLDSLGIPGIKYFDGNSRSAGKGTRNYVIFPGEEKNLKILDRGGIDAATEAAKNVAANSGGGLSRGYLPDVPSPTRSTLSQLARNSPVGEEARAIFDAKLHNDPSIVADALGLDTVTQKQVDLAANDLFYRTQESLKSRGIKGKVTVYRAGKTSKYHDSFSWEPWGMQKDKAIPYEVDAKDIIFDTEAIIPHGEFLEKEVFVRHGAAKPK